MNRSVVIGLSVAVLVILVAVVVGMTAYQAGVVRGLADAGKLPAPGPGGWAYHGPHWHMWPLGFGLLGPLLFFVVIFGLMRALWWGRWCRHGRCTSEIPPAFEAWHRRAHESPPERPGA